MDQIAARRIEIPIDPESKLPSLPNQPNIRRAMKKPGLAALRASRHVFAND